MGLGFGVEIEVGGADAERVDVHGAMPFTPTPRRSGGEMDIWNEACSETSECRFRIRRLTSAFGQTVSNCAARKKVATQSG